MAETILQTEDLTVAFGGLVAVDGVSLAVRRGEFKAVIGPNGAGKTTFFNLLGGIYKPTRGRVLFRGRDITGLKPHAIAYLGLGRSFQIAQLFMHLTVLENVRLAVQSRHRVGTRLLSHHTAFPGFIARAEQTLADVHLTGHEQQLAATLSHGDKRKLELAMLLATEPELLLLDEPTAGMSQDQVPPILALLERLKAAGQTIMLVEHKIDMVMRFSDSIAVLEYGRLIADGTPAQVAADPRVQQAYLGVSA